MLHVHVALLLHALILNLERDVLPLTDPLFEDLLSAQAFLKVRFQLTDLFFVRKVAFLQSSVLLLQGLNFISGTLGQGGLVLLSRLEALVFQELVSEGLETLEGVLHSELLSIYVDKSVKLILVGLVFGLLHSFGDWSRLGGGINGSWFRSGLGKGFD